MRDKSHPLSYKIKVLDYNSEFITHNFMTHPFFIYNKEKDIISHKS